MATPHDPAAVGIFDSLDNAKRSLEDLRRAGFSDDEIGIIGHVSDDETVPTPRDTHQREGNAIQGFMQGSVLGAIIGLVVIAALPGLAEVTQLGRWFELVGGVALGAVLGGVLLALASFVFTRSMTRFFAGELEKGR